MLEELHFPRPLHAMKACKVLRGKLHEFYDYVSSLDGYEQSASHFGYFVISERISCTHRIRNLMFGPRAGLDMVAKRKVFAIFGNRTHVFRIDLLTELSWRW
jgi:hypothetical protein